MRIMSPIRSISLRRNYACLRKGNIHLRRNNIFPL